MPHSLPPLSLSRNMVFSVCADLRACANWRGLADELLLKQEPSTILGVEHADWVAAQGR